MDMNSLWKARCEALEDSVIKMELHSRKDNIIFDGVSESDNENCADIIYDLLTEKLLIDNARNRIQFSRIHRIGKKKLLSYAGVTSSNMKPRPIIARVIHHDHKEEIMSRRRLLAEPPSDGEQAPGTKIWINHDLPESLRRAKRIWSPVLKMAKEKDKQSRIVGDKLSFKGQLYGTHDLSKLDLDIASLSMSMTSANVVFYGRYCPLSNFHPVFFAIDGVAFNCVEQYYQFQRALFARRRDIADQILLCKDPVKMKNLGDQLKTANSEWYDERAIVVMRHGLLAKFSKPQFKSFLLQLDERKIIEANKFDKFWSCGVSSNDPRINDSGSWPGRNTLGKLLMDIRAEI